MSIAIRWGIGGVDEVFDKCLYLVVGILFSVFLCFLPINGYLCA